MKQTRLKHISTSLLITALSVISFAADAANQFAPSVKSVEAQMGMESQAVHAMMTPAIKKSVHAYLFVSLGMPKLALRQYMRQSALCHIPMVIRGFLDDNYQKTAHRFWHLMHPKNKKPIATGIAIDPVWFKRFDIKVVPALVVESHNHYAVVYGNIPIKKALSIIANKSTNTDVKAESKMALAGELSDD